MKKKAQHIGEATGGGCDGGAFALGAFMNPLWFPAQGWRFCKALSAVLEGGAGPLLPGAW